MLLFSFIGLILLTFSLAAISHVIGITSFSKAFSRIMLFCIALIILGWVISPLRNKVVLSKEDYYGAYIINRKFFPGKQADWQYNSFRFEIRENDSIYFHVTEGEKIIQTFKGKVRFVTPYNSTRLIIDMAEPTHHIVSDNPTTFRSIWNFNLVFESPKFYNVYFKKGKWVPIN